MKTIGAIISGLTLFFYCCCPFEKEEQLGNNLYLSEYDETDRRIFYSEGACSGIGTEIVPMTVLEYAYNDEWIIAKSGSAQNNIEATYWIIKNDVRGERTADQIQSQTSGPLRHDEFYSLITAKKIRLTLKPVN